MTSKDGRLAVGADIADGWGGVAPHSDPQRGIGFKKLTLEQQWFRQFFIGILICVNNGACFTFGIFSPYMKRGAFNYDQSQVNLVSTVGVLLSYFSMPNGYLFDRKGPRATLLMGTLLNVSGWAGMFLVFFDMDRPLLTNSVAVMCFFYGLAQFSASFYETGSVLTNLRAFSCYRGRVVLIQKTFMGLGSSLVAQIYVAFFERNFNSIASFFFLLLCFSAVAGALSVAYVRLPSPKTQCLGLNVPTLEMLERGGGEPTMFDRPFNVGTGLLVLSVVFVLVVSLAENVATELSTTARTLIGASTIGLVASFISMVVVTPSYPENVGGFHESAEDAARRAVLLRAGQLAAGVAETPVTETPVAESPRHGCGSAAALVAEELIDDTVAGTSAAAMGPPGYGAFASRESHGAREGEHVPAPGEAPDSEVPPIFPAVADDDRAIVLNDAPLLVNLRYREIWLLWYICFASWGAMTLISSNSSQIYQAVAYDSFTLTVNTVNVSIYGVASALGRVLVGAALPLMERHRIPVASFLVAAPFMNLVGIPLFFLVPAWALFLPFFAVGLATGVSWGSTVLIVTSFFATSNCGKHYSWLYTAGMLSPFVFNTGLFGPIYDHYSRVQGHTDDHSCEGVVCFAAALLVCLVVNAFAIPCAVYFTKRTSERGGLRV